MGWTPGLSSSMSCLVVVAVLPRLLNHTFTSGARLSRGCRGQGWEAGGQVEEHLAVVIQEALQCQYAG